MASLLICNQRWKARFLPYNLGHCTLVILAPYRSVDLGWIGANLIQCLSTSQLTLVFFLGDREINVIN